MNKSTLALAAIGFSVFAGVALAKSDKRDPKVVSDVDLARYAGFWYEIAHDPNFFQRECERSTAQYGLKEDGTVSVLNTCYKDDEPLRTINGTASVVSAKEPAKLKVDFGFMGKGDYWIVALDGNYQWAVVSAPKKASLFILSRQAPMETNLLNQIVGDLKKRGFDTDSLIFDQY